MLGLMLSRLALRLLSAILGGAGIFCLIMSFTVPQLGAQAIVLLVTAVAIVYLSPSSGSPR
ncbi:MAG: hypothetical protein JO095_09230 [Alphaproteobacteria bacterium]|nr:hypothetical protein [Alphaproteobacteria bacterium]MBV9201946.1 hypothetical protein [Alphaproteobacteria bacterium]